MILQSLIEGIGIGLGIAVIVFLPSRLFPAKPKDTLLANLKEMEHRNKLLDEQNAILRISAGCAVDIKRINQQMLDLHTKHFKAATINEEMLEVCKRFEEASPLWIPAKTDEEHRHEAEVLHALRQRNLQAIAKAKGKERA